MNKWLCLLFALMFSTLVRAESHQLQHNCDSAHNNTDVFRLIVKDIAVKSSKMIVVKYNRFTGQAWHKKNKGWIAIQDVDDIPKARYLIKISETKDGIVSLFRLDQTSGKAWVVEDMKWKLL